MSRPRLKYSSCLYERDDDTLARAGGAAGAHLRAGAAGGRARDPGAGLWGGVRSLLWIAEQYLARGSRSVAFAHAAEHILGEAARRGLGNVRILVRHERLCGGSRSTIVVSVEMFEHMKNWPLPAADRWLAETLGLFFAHVFVHSCFAYHFVARDETDWMSRHFFTGGMMPSTTSFPGSED